MILILNQEKGLLGEKLWKKESLGGIFLPQGGNRLIRGSLPIRLCGDKYDDDSKNSQKISIKVHHISCR